MLTLKKLIYKSKSIIMNPLKFVFSSFAGGIIKFFLGFIFVGVLLKDFFAANGGPVSNPDTMVWWALIAGNLFSGVMLTYIYWKANISTLKKGAVVGFIIGLLIGLGNFLVTYAITLAPGLIAVAAHSLVSGVNYAIAGAVVALILGMQKKSAAS